MVYAFDCHRDNAFEYGVDGFGWNRNALHSNPVLEKLTDTRFTEAQALIRRAEQLLAAESEEFGPLVANGS